MPVVACIGMAVWDRIFSVADLPSGPTKAYAQSLDETGGGPAATASVAIARLGGTSKIIGRVGEDGVGSSIVEELQRFGVDVSGLKVVAGARSAWSAVAIDTAGERLIINFPGAGLSIAPDWLTSTTLQHCGALLADMGWPAGSEVGMRLAAEQGLPTILDADLSFAPDAVRLIGLAEHVLFSEAALRRYSQTDDPETGLLAVRRLASRARVLGVTLGSEGCMLLIEGRVERVPGFRVPVVDTLGAGDVFHGAYALAIAEGASAMEAARFGNAAAALKCTRKGGRSGAPVRAEVEALLAGL